MSEETHTPAQAANAYERYMPAIDVNDGLTRIMGNKKLYLSLLKRFKTRPMADDLVNRIMEGDPVLIAQSAHAIRGAAANLGLVQLKDVTNLIEERAKTGTDCTDQVERLQEAVDATEHATSELLENLSV